MKEAPEAFKAKFEIFYPRPSRFLTGTFSPKKNRISQIDALDIGESHSFTLTFEEDPRKDVSLKSGLLEISTEGREEHMTLFFHNQLKVQSEMTHVTETVVASSGRNLAIQVPKAPAPGCVTRVQAA